MGRGHTVLIGDSGQVWAAGGNVVGQLGVGGTKEEVGGWRLVRESWRKEGGKIIAVSSECYPRVLSLPCFQTTQNIDSD